MSSRIKGLTKVQREKSLQDLHVDLDVDASTLKLLPAMHTRNPRVASNFMVYLAGKTLQGVNGLAIDIHRPLPCELGLTVLSKCSSPSARNAIKVFNELSVIDRYSSPHVGWRDMISEMWFMSALESTSKLDLGPSSSANRSGKGVRPDAFVTGGAHYITPRESDYIELETLVGFFMNDMMRLGGETWKSVTLKPSYTLDAHTRPIAADLLVNGNMLLDVRCTMAAPQARRKKESDTIPSAKFPLSKSFQETSLLRMLTMAIVARREGTTIRKIGFILPYQQSYGCVSIHGWDYTVLEKLIFPNN